MQRSSDGVEHLSTRRRGREVGEAHLLAWLRASMLPSARWRRRPACHAPECHTGRNGPVRAPLECGERESALTRLTTRYGAKWYNCCHWHHVCVSVSCKRTHGAVLSIPLPRSSPPASSPRMHHTSAHGISCSPRPIPTALASSSRLATHLPSRPAVPALSHSSAARTLRSRSATPSSPVRGRRAWPPCRADSPRAACTECPTRGWSGRCRTCAAAGTKGPWPCWASRAWGRSA